ncbi:MAG: HAMP domain-containing sensor histidine kinase [Gemmatimonadota bacterium]
MTLPQRARERTGRSSPNERDLQNLQRLAMVGTLASGLGHDLRNVVMPVLLRLDVLGASAAIPEAARADLAAIRQSVLHLQRLAGGLRLLSSDPRESSEVQFTRLAPWWEEVCPLVVDSLAANTVLEQAMPPGIPNVRVPPSALAQVMMNLAMNARRAMEDVERPVLRVSASLVGESVQVEVEDNGRGMDEATRERCFDPFFTTRPRELSTGLGLSTARALMNQYGGDLTVDEARDNGSTFVMHLPVQLSTPQADQQSGRTIRFFVHDSRQLAVLRLIARQHGFREWEREPHVIPSDVIVYDAAALVVMRAGGEGFDSIGPNTQLIAIGSPQGTPDPLAHTQWVDVRDLSAFGDLLR